jgi:prepilin-type N-terminal cleavage/methylation domain-containing protein
MVSTWVQQKQADFTIVELLIVIVVIGIFAAITIVAYNGVQDRAHLSAMAADFPNNNKVVKLAGALTGNSPTSTDVLPSATKMTASQSAYKLASFCATTTGLALASELTNENKYYSLNG